MNRSKQKDIFQLFREQLEELIRARTPLFYLGAIELKRCIQELEIVASKLNAKIQTFHLSRGVLESGEGKKNTDPIGILDSIIKWVNTTTSEKQTVWVLPFFHLLFQNYDALIISKLRDIVEFNKFNGTVVIIGIPNYKLPPEFTDIQVLEFPIPDCRSIESLLSPNLSKDEKDRISRACFGFRLREIEDLFTRSMVRHGRIDPSTIEDLRADIIKQKGGAFLDIEFPKENLEQVGGMRVLKDWLKLREIGFTNPDLLKERNLPIPKGILLTGVPGCGKSLICKAIAGSWKFPLIRFKSIDEEDFKKVSKIKITITDKFGKMYTSQLNQPLADEFRVVFPSEFLPNQTRLLPGRYQLRIYVNSEKAWDTEFQVDKAGSVDWDNSIDRRTVYRSPELSQGSNLEVFLRE